MLTTSLRPPRPGGGPRPRARYRRSVSALVAGALTATALVMLPATSAQAAPALVSQNKNVTASSQEHHGTPATFAVDGDTSTRWSSADSDAQWLQVDLGATTAVSEVVLQWEAAYAKGYKIELSEDGELAHRALHHRRQGRHRDRPAERRRPVRPADRHRARHPVRLLALGVPGVRRNRHRRRPHRGRR
ncbi:discoidin domain-containing protein [Actinomadura keratinilytica]